MKKQSDRKNKNNLQISHKLRDKQREKLIDVYIKCSCNVSETCKRLKISRRTFYNWRKRFPEIDKQLTEAEEEMIDDCESKLHELIKDKDFRAIKFFLEKKGKSRGYGKQEKESFDNVIKIITHVPRPSY